MKSIKSHLYCEMNTMELTISEYLKEQSLKLVNRAKSVKKINESTWQGEIFERYHNSKIKFELSISSDFPCAPPVLKILNASEFEGWKPDHFDQDSGEIKIQLIRNWNPSIDLYLIVYNLIHLFNFSYYPLSDRQEMFNSTSFKKIPVYFQDDDINLYVDLNVFGPKDIAPQITTFCSICHQKILPNEVIFICPSCGSIGHRDHFLEWLKVKSRCPVCMQRLRFFDEHEIKCPQCDHKIENDSKFCLYCGCQIY